MDYIFSKSDKVNKLLDKFIELPIETQRLLFNYAYHSRERRGWFDALNLISYDNSVNKMNLLLKTAFDIANYETRCSHYGMDKYEVTINNETVFCDYALYSYSSTDGNINAANKLLLIDTGFVIKVRMLDLCADSSHVVTNVMEYMAQDFWNNPFDFVLKVMDYADDKLGEQI